jgi:hypothetical protein
MTKNALQFFPDRQDAFQAAMDLSTAKSLCGSLDNSDLFPSRYSLTAGVIATLDSFVRGGCSPVPPEESSGADAEIDEVAECAVRGIREGGSPTFFVVTTTKGEVCFTTGVLNEQELAGYGFEIGQPIRPANFGLYLHGNRIGHLFTNKDDLDGYLSGFLCEAKAIAPELIGWWFP